MTTQNENIEPNATAATAATADADTPAPAAATTAAAPLIFSIEGNINFADKRNIVEKLKKIHHSRIYNIKDVLIHVSMCVFILQYSFLYFVLYFFVALHTLHRASYPNHETQRIVFVDTENLADILKTRTKQEMDDVYFTALMLSMNLRYTALKRAIRENPPDTIIVTENSIFTDWIITTALNEINYVNELQYKTYKLWMDTVTEEIPLSNHRFIYLDVLPEEVHQHYYYDIVDDCADDDDDTNSDSDDTNSDNTNSDVTNSDNTNSNSDDTTTSLPPNGNSFYDVRRIHNYHTHFFAENKKNTYTIDWKLHVSLDYMEILNIIRRGRESAPPLP